MLSTNVRRGARTPKPPTPQNAIMGVQWSFNNPSPSLVRLADAAELVALPGIGTVAGHSDFDLMPIYKNIRRCNVAANGTVTAYEGQSGFSFTVGDVMVEIPLFYYRIEHETTNMRRRMFVSDQQAEGFLPHPAFARPFGTVPYIYIGAYETGAGHVSRSGLAPLVSQTRAQFRTGARGKGTLWSIQDFAAREAVTLLMIIEFANLNTQYTIAPGNTSGFNAALNTGRTNSIVGTGREAGTNPTQLSFVWRGIENWWGNVWEWVDGLNINERNPMFCLNPAQFADDTVANYTPLGYNFTSAGSGGFSVRLGFDPNNPWAALPNDQTGGSETTFLCDILWHSTGWRVALVGGNWRNGGSAGAFAWNLSSVATGTGSSFGARLLCIPR